MTSFKLLILPEILAQPPTIVNSTTVLVGQRGQAYWETRPLSAGWPQEPVTDRRQTLREGTARSHTRALGEDIGRAVVFLISEDAKSVAGQALHVEGGADMGYNVVYT